MKEIVYNVTFVFQMMVFALSLYYLVLSLFGLYKKTKKMVHKPEKSFALIVAAHNEEMVVENIVDSLKKLDYPKELYDVFVIADNCDDNTAKVARAAGAQVFERLNKNKRGKGYALEWMFDRIFKMEKHYDAVGIFDADNLVSPNFLMEMNNVMRDGFKVVQGYIDSKNPEDSWITESYSIAFWTANRLFQMARSNLKLSNQIGGTGFVVDVALLKELGWGATCLTEDLEFTCKLVLNGEKVGWAHNAIVYDEKPLTLRQSWNQRKRWMQGFADVASRFFFRVLKKAIVERSMVALDCALYTIQPFVTLALGISLVITLIQNNSPHGANIFVVSALFPLIFFKLFSTFQFLLTPLALKLEKKMTIPMFVLLILYSSNIYVTRYFIGDNPTLLASILTQGAFLSIFVLISLLTMGKKGFKFFFWFLLYGIYTLTWIPITVQGIANKNKKDWNHTKHTRQITISEV